MRKIVSLLLAFIFLFSVVHLTVFADNEENTNLLSEADSTFESGETNWNVFTAGELSFVDNPKGEGKVMKYQVDTNAYIEKNNTWQSCIIDLKPFIKEANTLYIAMDIFCEDAFNVQIMIRSKKEHLDFAMEKDSEYMCLGFISGESEWAHGVFSFEITDEDIERTEGKWELCFDRLPTIRKDLVIYVDNVYVGFEEPEEPEKETIELPEINAITKQENTLIGAIRWDAYFETDSKKSNVSQQVAKALSPSEFHWRAPFFSNIDDAGNVTFPGYSPEIIEKEIDYAKTGGLDYFAYLWYETTDPMSDPRKLHLQSEKKNDVLMCGILETIRSKKTMDELFEAMKDECYVRIDNRPVVFLYQYDSKWTQKMIDELRQAAVKAGVTEALYLVGMISSKDIILKNASIKNGAEAFSWYAIEPKKAGGIEYVEFADYCRSKTEEFGAMSRPFGYSLIPCVLTGYDIRPRLKNPVSWVGGDITNPDKSKWPYGNKFTFDASPEEIGELLKFTLDYVKENSNNSKVNMVLTYAWNEHDEGGWICPTVKCDENGKVIYNEDGTAQIDTQRIDAYRKVIDAYREIEHTEVEATATPPADITPDTSVEATPNNDEAKESTFNVMDYWWILPIVAVIAVAIGIIVVVIVKKKK